MDNYIIFKTKVILLVSVLLLDYYFTLNEWTIGTDNCLTASVLLNPLSLLALLERLFVVLIAIAGFLSMDNNSAEDNLTFEEEFKVVFEPVAAEAKLSIIDW